MVGADPRLSLTEGDIEVFDLSAGNANLIATEVGSSPRGDNVI